MAEGYADFHSHLVPGVDDGSRTLDDALHSIGRMVDAGVTRVITTPHLWLSQAAGGRLAGFLDYHDQRWAPLERAVRARYPGLDFRRGFEVKLDRPDPDLSDPRLRLGGTRFVLVEWPLHRIPPGTPEILERIAQSGLVPIVAHPERYRGVGPGFGVVREWKQAGALLQGNYGSLAEQNGPAVQAFIVQMLEQGILDYLCSDFHGRRGYTFYMVDGARILSQLGGDEQLEILGKVNTARLFDGEAPLPAPSLRLGTAPGRTPAGGPPGQAEGVGR